MARANNLIGLDTIARRETSKRAFEDMKAGKVDSVNTQTHEVSEKGTDAKAKHAGRISMLEAPTFRARLTIRDKKIRSIKTGVSIADE